MEKDIGTLNSKKALQYCDIPTRTIKKKIQTFFRIFYMLL